MRNKYENRGEITAIIVRGRGGEYVETIIDTSCLGKLANTSWYGKYDQTTKSYYILGRKNRENKTFQLARFLMDAPRNLQVDHINRNSLDNRLCNLRLVTQSENQQNTNLRKDNTSGCRGVKFESSSGNWSVRVQVNKKRHSLGRFDTYEEAAERSNQARAQLMPMSTERQAVISDDIDLMEHRRKANSNNKSSGLRNIHKKGNKWIVYKRINGKREQIGAYFDEETAKRKLEEINAIIENDPNGYVRDKLKPTIKSKSGYKHIFWVERVKRWKLKFTTPNRIEKYFISIEEAISTRDAIINQYSRS